MNSTEKVIDDDMTVEMEAISPDLKKRHGLVIVNTGDGKGKTTAALGVAFRALGNGFRVFMVQYIQGEWKPGELKMAEKLAPNLIIKPMGDGSTRDARNSEQAIATTRKIWEVSQDAIRSGLYDIVILDEINVVMKLGYLDPSLVVEVLKNRNPRQHVILTGRGAPASIIEVADLVSEILPIKHPHKSGINPQRGIEF